ncbi:MAG TPA: FAD-dependent oxidoreductase [Acidimicrobiia bacterium]|nr:FAD-dependent oxidoreductase [Acidimicrobiia bacterium]
METGRAKDDTGVRVGATPSTVPRGWAEFEKLDEVCAPDIVAVVPAPETVVVVGASLAGLRAAEELRRLGFDGHLVLVGAEDHLPYDRPPLSKAVLAGEAELGDISLRRGPYEDLDLDLRLGRRATALDVATRAVMLDDGETVVGTRGLVLATGATPRRVPGLEPGSGVHELRTVDDCLALRRDLDANPTRVVVVGAGFIGAEVAATCRGRGLDVTVLEALPVPMVRGLGPTIGAVLAELHRDHGVDLRTGVGVERLDRGERVERVHLADGSAVDADVVVVGIGVVPATEWLVSSGLTIDNGVVCDATLLAAPGIVAAGDLCRWPNVRFDVDGTSRLEHWTNAAEQGVAAAARILASDEEAVAFDPVPFVWSDQYDVKIQVVGDVRADDDLEIVDGSLEARKFVAAVGRAGRLVGAVAFSRPRPLMQLRRMIVDGASLADALASNEPA